MSRDLGKPNRRSIRLPTWDYSRAAGYFVTTCVKNREPLFGRIINGRMGLNEFGKIIADAWNGLPHHFPTVGLDEFVVMPNHIHGIIVIREHGANDETRGIHVENDESCPVFVEAGLPRLYGTRPYGGPPHVTRPYDTHPDVDRPNNTQPRDIQPHIDRAHDAQSGDIQSYDLRPVQIHPTLGQVMGYFKYQTTRRINELRGTPGMAVWQRNYHERILRNDEWARIRGYIKNNPENWESDSQNSTAKKQMGKLIF